MPWSLSVGNISVADMHTALSAAIDNAPPDMFAQAEHKDQAVAAIAAAEALVAAKVLGELSDDTHIVVSMAGHATPEFAPPAKGEPYPSLTVNVSRPTFDA